jgi:hypothetical protein
MSTQEVYIMQDTDDEWVQPTPVGTAVTEALVDNTELEAGDVEELGAYLDIHNLETVLDTDEREQLRVDVEGYDVIIHEDGDIVVDN